MFDPTTWHAPAADAMPVLPTGTPVIPAPGLPRPLVDRLSRATIGTLLIDDQSTVLYVNPVARRELDDDHPLQMLGTHLRVRHAVDLRRLRDALDAAQRRGRRSRRVLGAEESCVKAVVLPAGAADAAAEPLLVLAFSRVRPCAGAEGASG